MARATAIGLMSGTSYDGVDVALIETDGEEIGRLGPTGYRPYSDPEREVVRRAIAVAANLTDRSARPAMLAAIAEHGVRLAPGPSFGVAGTMERYVRLPFTLPETDLTEAVRRLAAASADLARARPAEWTPPALVA